MGSIELEGMDPMYRHSWGKGALMAQFDIWKKELGVWKNEYGPKKPALTCTFLTPEVPVLCPKCKGKEHAMKDCKECDGTGTCDQSVKKAKSKRRRLSTR